MTQKYTILHASAGIQTDRWTLHIYPSSMYGDKLERPISILFKGDRGDIEALDLSREEARLLALSLLAGANVA